MKYRVIQWATGGGGSAAIEGILDHPELELVGCWVHSKEKVGLDAAAIAGREPVGVPATNDVEALLRLDADCVLYSPIMANAAEIERILSAGINIVTPLGWFYPKGLDTAAVEAACRLGGATLHGTGIHPGGITERFPLMFSAMSRAITHIRAEEFSDIRTYDAPQVIGDIMLFGKTPEEAKASPMLHFLGSGFMQSIDMVADTIGVELDSEKRALHE
ncbi:MAG: dihydrodipicolinate reductase, partial [Myxococcales bacterium]